MSKITKEVRIGVAFIVALFLLYFGINFLKGINIFKPANSYVVVFDNVAGLLKADPVTVNGFQIGQVFEMELNPNDASKVLVHINLNKDMKIPKGSKIIMDNSMLGSSTLLLEPTNSTDYYVTSDTLFGVKKSGLMDVADRVVPQIEKLVPKIDSVLSAVNALANSPALSETLNNVNDLTGNLAKTSKEFNRILAILNKDLPTISGNLVETTNNFGDLSKQFKTMDIGSTFNSVDSTLRNVQYLSTKLISKDNSIGLLMNDRQLYDSLNSTLGNASLLLRDVKENPSRYINVKVF